MATKTLQPIAVYRQEGKEGVIWDRAPGEEESMSYKAGAPLVRDGTSKELEEWAGGTDASLIEGIAVKDATGTTGAAVPYYEATDNLLLAVSLINATTAYTLLGTERGVSYSLIKSGNNWYGDVADTTTDIIEVVGLIDAVGDVNPRVIARIVTAKQASGV